MNVDDLTQWWEGISDWLIAHDLKFDEFSVWALAVGFSVLSLVKAGTWWAIWRQRDRTPVGRALKAQKAAEVIAWGGMAALYGLTLYGYYQQYQFGFWPRLGIRALVVSGITVAAVAGLRFIRAFRRERWGQPEPPR